MKKIRKAVFPAAGLGTRFLPATKSQPKEMLPLVDKPMIQYVIEEAKNSGIEHIVIVTGRGKSSIEDHFDISFELEHNLESKGKLDLLQKVRSISDMITVSYVRQKEPLGLGHAILVAKDIIGNEPFAVFLGDDIVDSSVPCMKQMMMIYEEKEASVLALQKVPMSMISSYGVVKAEQISPGLHRIEDLVEKPPIEEAPTDLAIIGRYILGPEIFSILESTPKGSGGEIQLTDGLREYVKTRPIYGLEFEGRRYDTGSKIGYLEATVEFALKDQELGEQFRSYLKRLKL
ncbi:MAG: UTP--glucose-1-phosphate uridylyltransferase GalU [Candidatus Cloacimonetes bacterium]|nr:UTP--glucose-1-phosphate uridylyltransferase GalU [Candidatus Cloacimonadota bacterium]